MCEEDRLVYAPGYWKYETSGRLAAAVHTFISGRAMTEEQVGLMRAYLRQWMAVDWRGEGIAALREDVEKIVDRVGLAAWLDSALHEGLDPL